MKKIIAVLLSIVTVCIAFVACSKSDDNNVATSQTATTTTGITTDSAKITDNDAVMLIKSYSDKELGLTTEQREDCDFLVAGNGVEVDGNYYVEVVAAVKNEHKDDKTGEITYTFDNQGVYYISYDGKTILSKDTSTGEYSKMKTKQVPTTESTTVAEESTTKK